MAHVARTIRIIMFVWEVHLGIVVVFMGIVGVLQTIVGRGIARVEHVRHRRLIGMLKWMYIHSLVE
jgi:hypothetical protein